MDCARFPITQIRSFLEASQSPIPLVRPLDTTLQSLDELNFPHREQKTHALATACRSFANRRLSAVSEHLVHSFLCPREKQIHSGSLLTGFQTMGQLHSAIACSRVREPLLQEYG